MNITELSKLASQGRADALLLQLLLEIYRLQQDLIAVRQALGVAQPDEQIDTTQDWSGKDHPF